MFFIGLYEDFFRLLQPVLIKTYILQLLIKNDIMVLNINDMHAI